MKCRRAISLTLCLVLCLVALAALLLFAGSSASARSSTTRYVATSGNDTGDCTNSDYPCRSVQYAVDAAVAGDLIKVAAGDYTDVQSRPAPPGYNGAPSSGLIEQMVYIDESITIRGGYTTPGYADPPDPQANPTTLDAQGQGRVVVFAGEASPTLEGFRITGGSAASLGGAHSGDGGGGMFALTAAPIIRDNHVYENSALFGGGQYLVESDATLSGNTISTNTAEFGGGGLYLFWSDARVEGNTITANMVEWYGGGVHGCCGTATLSGNTISGNSAYHGGGLYLSSQADFVVKRNKIISNTATHDGGGLYVSQNGAILSRNTVSGNTAQESGGGVYLDRTFGAVKRNTISGNEAGRGGGLLVDSDAQLSANTISGNTAQADGGGLHIDDGSPMLTGNVIRENLAEGGGGLSAVGYSQPALINNVVADNQAGSLGSGVYIRGPDISLLHTTIARNTGGDASGINVTGYSGNPSSVHLWNTIVVSHTVGVYAGREYDTVTLEGTLWGADSWSNVTDWAGPGTIVTQTPNVWGNPAFSDPDRGDYHIGPGSAAIDTGMDAGVMTDIDGEPRPMLAGYDIGADEVFLGPRLEVAKNADPERPLSGDQLTYTLFVTNTGTVSLTATITDILPTHVTPPGILSWMPPPLIPDETWKQTVVVSTDVGFAGPLTNVVQVWTEQGVTGVYTHTVTVKALSYLPLVLRNAP